jgi:hypothetical protein
MGRLTQLEELSLRPESVIELKHANMLARARSLKFFDLGYAEISAAAMSELAAIPALSNITIDCDSFDSQTAKPLKEYYLTDEVAEALATFPALRSVMLFHTRITDDGIAELCKLTRLETLVVSSPHVTGASFDHLLKLRRVKHLGTWGWQLQADDLAKLSEIKTLEGLDLQTNLTNECVPHLLPLHLERLTLRGEKVTDASVQYLCELHDLSWLNLSDTAIQKNSAAAALLKQSLPRCTIRFPKTAAEMERERNFHSGWFSN